jgi:hypothetical protein
VEQASGQVSEARDVAAAASDHPTICYVAEGKLYLKRPGAEAATLIESTFAQELIDRAQRGRDRNGWRQQGMMWNFGSGGRGMLPPGMPEGPPAEVRRVRFTGVAPGGAGAAEIFYALDTDHVGGLFQYDLREGYERRLYHAHEFRADDLSRHATSGQLAMSVREPDGTAHLALADANGRKLRKVTEGDVVDQCPSWVGGGANALVYQSAGVGRSEQGFRTSLSPYVVHRLNLDDGSMQTLAEDGAYDFLLPRIDARDGALWCIRRPYQPHGAPVSPWRVLLDVVLFPYRLVRAIVHFLDFFSRVFSRQPLMTAGGPPREGPDQRSLLLWGKVIDAEKEMRRAGRESASLVPDSWQLVRRNETGQETVVARGVVAYDLCPDGGGVVYTNGSAITRINANGTAELIERGRLIERVRVLPTTAAAH